MSTEGSVEGLLADCAPSPEELAAAPLLNNWQCQIDKSGAVCMGLSNRGLTVLRDIRVIDQNRQWLRTAGELWRLGWEFEWVRPGALAKIEDDLAKLKEPTVGAVIIREEDFADECAEAASGVVVVSEIGGVIGANAKDVKAAFGPIVGRRLPVYPVPDIVKVKSALVAEFPHAESLLDVMLADLPGRSRVKFRNTLLVGAAGCGKSRLARRMGEALGVHVGSFDGAGAGDAAFGGTGRRWSTGEPCWPLHVIRSCGHANPLVLVDEIDKAGTARHNGNLYNSILTLLENETAARFADPYIQAPVDVSNVSYLLTANDDAVLPAMLKDRLRILRMPSIRPEHVPAISRGIVVDLAQERGLDERWVVQLTGDEIEIAQRMLGDGSIRRLRAVVERLLAQREMSAPRN